ncbi:MAG: peptide chain release factor 1 [bacterium]|nr:peptide chain release factor 1 [bacterium]
MDLNELQQKKDELQEKLGDPEVLKNAQKVKELSIEFSKTEKQLSDYTRIAEIEKELKETEEILTSSDEEIKPMARSEKEELLKEMERLEKKISGVEENLPSNVIMEIRAGAGGTEASLFAKELFDMYSSFAKKKGWKTALLDESKSDLEGYKEVVFEIDGENVYELMRWESGVHRVQRIPETEKMGRVHTSTASIAVLPKAKEVDLEIRPQDIKVEFFRSSGPGGQNVNKVETAVRVYHLPTGVTVVSQEGRSQQKNRERAMTILRSKLLDAQIQAEAKKMASARKKQIGTGDRSEKIRTYNFPQDRVTDHRIKESWHNLPGILAGNLDDIVGALNQQTQE